MPADEAAQGGVNSICVAERLPYRHLSVSPTLKA
jgi:hypothetical protein